MHQQNLYTDCGRHSNEWLFSGWGDLAKWALGGGSRGKEDGGRRRRDEHEYIGQDEGERGRRERRDR